MGDAVIGDWFVYLLMALNLGASVAYAWQGHGIKALYWLTVFVLNFCLLKMK